MKECCYGWAIGLFVIAFFLINAWGENESSHAKAICAGAIALENNIIFKQQLIEECFPKTIKEKE